MQQILVFERGELVGPVEHVRPPAQRVPSRALSVRRRGDVVLDVDAKLSDGRESYTIISFIE